MTKPRAGRHRVRLIKRKGCHHIYDIKVIDGVDEEVQWGEAVHKHRSHQWLITRDGSEAALHIEAHTLDELRTKLEQLLDEAEGGAK